MSEQKQSTLYKPEKIKNKELKMATIEPVHFNMTEKIHLCYIRR